MKRQKKKPNNHSDDSLSENDNIEEEEEQEEQEEEEDSEDEQEMKKKPSLSKQFSFIIDTAQGHLPKAKELSNYEILPSVVKHRRPSQAQTDVFIETTSHQSSGRNSGSGRPKKLFNGICFLLTKVPQAAKDLVRRNGGKILESEEDLESLRWFNKKLILVADKTCRTFKYFLGMALGIPMLSTKWLMDCVQEKKLLYPPSENYLLILGNVDNQSIIVSSTQIQRTNPDMRPVALEQRLFFGYNIYLYPPEPDSEWERTLRIAGCSVKPTSIEECHFVVICRDPITRKLQSLSAEVTDKCYRYQKQVVTEEYLIQCLMMNSILPKDENFLVKITPYSSEDKTTTTTTTILNINQNENDVVGDHEDRFPITEFMERSFIEEKRTKNFHRSGNQHAKGKNNNNGIISTSSNGGGASSTNRNFHSDHHHHHGADGSRRNNKNKTKLVTFATVDDDSITITDSLDGNNSSSGNSNHKNNKNIPQQKQNVNDKSASSHQQQSPIDNGSAQKKKPHFVNLPMDNENNQKKLEKVISWIGKGQTKEGKEGKLHYQAVRIALDEIHIGDTVEFQKGKVGIVLKLYSSVITGDHCKVTCFTANPSLTNELYLTSETATLSLKDIQRKVKVMRYPSRGSEFFCARSQHLETKEVRPCDCSWNVDDHVVPLGPRKASMSLDDEDLSSQMQKEWFNGVSLEGKMFYVGNVIQQDYGSSEEDGNRKKIYEILGIYLDGKQPPQAFFHVKVLAVTQSPETEVSPSSKGSDTFLLSENNNQQSQSNNSNNIEMLMDTGSRQVILASANFSLVCAIADKKFLQTVRKFHPEDPIYLFHQ